MMSEPSVYAAIYDRAFELDKSSLLVTLYGAKYQFIGQDRVGRGGLVEYAKEHLAAARKDCKAAPSYATLRYLHLPADEEEVRGLERMGLTVTQCAQGNEE